MEPADLSSFAALVPVWSFLLVFLTSFVVLHKTKLVESKWVQLFLSFFVATLFISAASAREYVAQVAPWVGVLLVSLFFIMLIAMFVGKPLENMHSTLGTIFIVGLFVIFFIAAIYVFSSQLAPYLPGSTASGGDSTLIQFTDWLYSPRVYGPLLLLIIAAAVSWVLVK